MIKSDSKTHSSEEVEEVEDVKTNRFVAPHFTPLHL